MISFTTQNDYPIKIPSTFHNYKLVELLGRGSTSIVLLVEDEKSKELYSAKIISKTDAINRNAYDSIIREINVHKSLYHPNIIQFIESFEITTDDDEFIVIIMEYCEKGDLLTYVTKYGFKTETIKKKIFRDFLKAVQYLHSNQISHGDIKAENILLDSNLSAKLCDFGYCRTRIRVGDECKKGTLYYSAPELLTEGQFNALKSDIYAIGITLYTLSELELPFDSGSDDYIIEQIVTGNLTFAYNMDQKLRKLVKKCTDLNPANRPTIDEILNDEYFNDTKKSVIPHSQININDKNSNKIVPKCAVKKKWNNTTNYDEDYDSDYFI